MPGSASRSAAASADPIGRQRSVGRTRASSSAGSRRPLDTGRRGGPAGGRGIAGCVRQPRDRPPLRGPARLPRTVRPHRAAPRTVALGVVVEQDTGTPVLRRELDLHPPVGPAVPGQGEATANLDAALFQPAIVPRADPGPRRRSAPRRVRSPTRRCTWERPSPARRGDRTSRGGGTACGRPGARGSRGGAGTTASLRARRARPRSPSHAAARPPSGRPRATRACRPGARSTSARARASARPVPRGGRAPPGRGTRRRRQRGWRDGQREGPLAEDSEARTRSARRPRLPNGAPRAKLERKG